MAKFSVTGQATIYNMNDVLASSTPPPKPTEGALWLNEKDNQLYVYIKGSWVISADYKNWVNSKGDNLVSNGGGSLGNNSNFSAFEFDGSDSYSGGGSFKDSSPANQKLSDELIPVDISKSYKLSLWAKTNPNVGAKYYVGVFEHDMDGLPIYAENHMYVQSTFSSLTQDLKNGDTVVYLDNVTNWLNTAPIHQRKLIFWDYVSKTGYKYQPLTYSRHTSAQDLWADGSINTTNKTITLKAPWNGGLVTAGTKLSQGSSGSGFRYIAVQNAAIPGTWTNYSGVISGLNNSGNDAQNQFSWGTAYVKIGFLNNRDVTGSTVWYSNISFGLNVADQGDVDKINDSLDALGSDGKITRFERSLVRGYIADIIGKFLAYNEAMPTLAQIDADTYNAGKLYSIRRMARKIGMNLSTSVNYKPLGDAYTALVTYLTSLTPVKPWDTTSSATINIDRNTWNARWNEYYNRYALFEIEVQDRQKEYTDSEVGKMKDETIAAISTAGNHDTVVFANPVNVKPPIATLGLPEFEGYHTDSFYVNGRNVLAGTATAKTIVGENRDNQTSTIYTFVAGNSAPITGVGTFTVMFDWIIEGAAPAGTMYMQGSNPYPGLTSTITFSSSNRSGRYIGTGSVAGNIATFNGINMRCNFMVGKLTISNMKIAVGNYTVNPVYTPAPEEAWAGAGNRFRPVTNPLFSSGTDLTIWGKFYGDGTNNDKFYWNTNGAAIKEKKWVDARLDEKQTWAFSSNGTSTDGVNKFLKSSCNNEYPILFDDTVPNRSGRATMAFYEDYIIMTCNDPTDSFYQLGSYDMNLHGFAVGDKITFSAEVNADFAGAYLSVWHSDGTNWIENKGGTGAVGTAGTWQRLTQTFTIPSNAKGLFCRIYFARVAGANTTKLRFRKVQLELGITATTWSPTNLQTFKRVRTDGFAIATPVYASEQVVKYDATILDRNGNTPQADQMAMNATNGTLYIAVDNKDSGWGDTYTPTPAEITAYFLGWKMCNGTFGTNYTGTGSKMWHPLKDKDLSRATAAGSPVPTEASPSLSDKTVNYYQVLYQLVDAVQETVEFDGILELLASDNVVTTYYPTWTPPITKGTIKYGTNLATVNQDTRYIIPSMVKRISNAEQKITDDAITNTVTNSREYTLALKSKANASDLGGLASRDELNNVANGVDGKIKDAMDKLDFSPYATKSELKQTATDITAKFSATGGMNLIKNSIGYSDRDFWSLTTAYLVDTISNSALDNLGFGRGFYFRANGQETGIYQDVSVIPGQPYTLGWYLNKMTKGADSSYRFWIQVQEYNGTAWVVTNQIADNKDVTTNGFEARYMTFTPTKDKVRIRFIGYANVEAIVSGIMLNIGDVALQWTLATGELYNTNIRMNINGIRVSQLDANGSEIGFTQITPSEFAGYYQNNGTFEKVFYLNGDETVTKKLRATSEITLGNIKILSIQSATATGWAFVPNNS
ncbi:tail protein [Bacillus phage TsarBomba]|uniref:Minor tail protein n=1 Tax=Bacillus phage TsarBomba TaxID=1690456 RepID=A0A0K2D0A9_9CAUD|nr:tail protein [Bacillus phage TsarBomba]ALA13026.1 minor tail protein [Bacillus phage TsarBomba]